MFKVRVFFETRSGVIRSVNLCFPKSMSITDIKDYWRNSGFDRSYGETDDLDCWHFYKAQYFDKENDVWTDLK